MEYGVIIHTSKSKDVALLETVTKQANRRNVLDYRRKSIRLYLKGIEFFPDNADNFVRNLVTILYKYDGYKMPRIVKRLLK